MTPKQIAAYERRARRRAGDKIGNIGDIAVALIALAMLMGVVAVSMWLGWLK